jgi:hypothetical protein
MRKKFKIIILFLVINFLTLSTNVLSEEKCGLYFEKLKSDYLKYQPELDPQYEFNDLGFELKLAWNFEKEDWQYYQDKEGYYYVGRITDFNLVGQINNGDKIISANNLDLRKLNLDNYDLTFQDIFDDGEIVDLVFDDNKKEYSLSLKKFKRDLIDPFIDVYIKSLVIDEPSKKIEARIALEAANILPDDDPMYELAKEILWFDDKESIKSRDTKGCFYNVEDWDDAYFSIPAGGFSFANLHSSNNDTFQNVIYLKPYTESVEWHKENNWENQLYIEYSEDGVHNFNMDFKYKNFPFDKQKIVIRLINGYDMSDGLLSPSDYSKRSLNFFQENNKISGWKIVNSQIVYNQIQEPNNIYPASTVDLELYIERESGYYLYKVILPIIIILVVCWSSIWILPKELEAKLTITIVCLLSLIAYNFVIDGELPKLEYLTIIDWIILVSYFYAALPNILGIYFSNLHNNKNYKKLKKFEIIAKKYGLLSYLSFVFFIIILNVSLNKENASAIVSWMS